MEFPTSLDMLVMIVKTKIHKYTCFDELKDAKYAASQDFTMSLAKLTKESEPCFRVLLPSCRVPHFPQSHCIMLTLVFMC